MALTKKDVDYVAGLARLDLSEAEKDTLTQQLGQILAYVDKLNELDTSNVPPTSHVLELVNVFRDDVAVPSYPLETMEKSAPDWEKGHYKVPKIIGGE